MNNPGKLLLFKQPWRFEFFQAIRLLLRGEPGASRFNPALDPLKIAAHQTLAFPVSDIAAFEESESGDKPKMKINFLGLTGPSGSLPLHYTSLMIDRELKKDDAPIDFFDIFNHRLAMLFYYAWERCRIPAQYERETDEEGVREMVLDMLGLGAAALRNRQHFSDDFFIYYAPLLLSQPRSASAFRAILADYFQAPVEVRQFAGAWYALDAPSISRFDTGDTESERLGYGVVAGSEYWSHESMVRLRIGPVGIDIFERFLPRGAYYESLRQICRFYSRDEFAFELQLVLNADEVPELKFPEELAGGVQLGLTTWLKSKSKPFARVCEDVVIPLC